MAQFIEQRIGDSAVFGAGPPVALALRAFDSGIARNKIYSPQRTQGAFAADLPQGRSPFVAQFIDGHAVFGTFSSTAGNAIFDVQTFQSTGPEASNHWKLDDWRKWHRDDDDHKDKKDDRKAKREAEEVIERAQRKAREKLLELETREAEVKLAKIERESLQLKEQNEAREAMLQAQALALEQQQRDNDDLMILLLMASE